MGQQVVNNIHGTVAVAIAPTDFSITLSSGIGAAVAAQAGTLSPTNFVLATFAKKSGGRENQWEIMKFTSRSGDVFSGASAAAVRGQEGGAALSWSIGELVSFRLTRGTIQPILGGSLFTQEYDSSVAPGVQPYTGSTPLTLPHGFGALPRLVSCFLKCIAPADGYVIDEIIEINPALNSSGAASGIALSMDTTNIYVKFGAFDIGEIAYTKKSDGLIGSAFSSNFRFFVRAYR